MQLVIKFLRLICGSEHYGLVGDIHEMYEVIKEKSGNLKALCWLSGQIISTIALILKNSISSFNALIRNYSVIAIRNIYRNKLYSIINIAGLSIGITCSILIFMWVADEVGHDEHMDKNVYRFILQFKSGKSSKTPDSMAPFLKERIPEIVEFTQLHKRPKWSVSYTSESGEKRVFFEKNLFLTDRSMFSVFNLKFLQGNLDSGFRGVVISQKTAKKYFGDENPLGKKLNFNNWYDSTVTAVVEDVPENSHFTGEIYSNRLGLKRHWAGGFNWQNHVHELYLKVEAGSDIEEIEARIYKLLLELNINRYRETLKAVELQRADKIYLYGSEISSEYVRYGDVKYVYIFSLIAIFILFIACLNFMNLMTARAENRIREVAIRKVSGAGLSSLIPQFIGEALCFAMVSGLFSIISIYLLLPLFNNLVNKKLVFSMMTVENLFQFFVIIVATGIFAGTYPAVFIASKKTVTILKNTRPVSKSFFSFRNILVIIQFGFSVLLIIGTLVTNSQITYLQKKKLGFNKEHILCIPSKGNFTKSYAVVKEKLLKIPSVTAVSIKDCYPTRSVTNSAIDWSSRGSRKKVLTEVSSIGFDYLKLMKINILSGRGFDHNIRGDIGQAVVVNQSFTEAMGIDNPSGMEIKIGKSSKTIVGVMEDANFKSLHQRIRPLLLRLTEITTDNTVFDLFGIILIKIAPGHEDAVLSEVRNLWQSMNSAIPFDYNFLDDIYNNLYKKESTISSIINVFSILAIIISALGIFGLASFAAEQRTREIGIRKVLGASTGRVMALLSTDFLKLVIYSNIIAWPLAYMSMSKWLQNFKYQAELSLWFFIIAGIIALGIAQLSVSFQSFRAASKDPVRSLKHE